MCGIVGLFIKNPQFESELGQMISVMLEVMTDRGPDSAGFSIYGEGHKASIKISLRGSDGTDFISIASGLEAVAGQAIPLTIRSSHAILTVPADRETAVRTVLAEQHPGISVVGSGQRMEIYKEVGLPADVEARFDLAGMAGTHAIGHTRMATESAVTTAGAHPFSTGMDQCLVHNGSLSNHNVLRRKLTCEGIRFTTDNDSEVAAGYLTWRMRQGDSLKDALIGSLDALDGFFTFVVGTETGFAVLRDPIACKPAVMAETDDYVAFGSEYRVLADLPGIAKAKVWEPKPATVYSWERAA